MAEVASAFVSLVPSARNFGRQTERQVGGQLAGAGKKIGASFGRTLFGAAAAVGAAFGVAHLFSDSLGEARESQKVAALSAQVIKSTGGVANVTAKQLGKLSTAISKKTGIDDEQIQSGSNMLLTFKNIRNEAGKNNKIFDQATQITTDMAAAMAAASGGQIDLKSSSIQVGKALNDPIKGITALGRVGVTFTDSQKAQIKALVESGKKMAAQKIILGELKSEFGGAAAAVATNGDKAKVALGNLKESIGTAFLPIVDRLSGAFTNKIAPALSNFVGDIGPAARKVKNFFTNGAGAKPLAKAMGAIGDAVGAIKDGFGVAADNFDRLKNGVEGFSLKNLDGKAIGEALGKALVDGVQFIGKNVGKIGAAISNLFGKVDWVGIGIAIGRQAPALLLGLAAGILNFDFGSLLRGIGDHWFEILMGVLILAFAPSKFLGPLEKILTKIPFVGRFLAAAVRWLNDLGGKLTKFGGDLFKAFAEGFGKVKFPGAGLISRVMGAFKQLPARILSFWVTLQVRIGVWALDAFAAAGRGARTALGRLPGILAKVPGVIKSAFSGAGRFLFNAGKAVIQGLLDGLGAMLGALKSKLKSITDLIPKHKGPLSKDERLLEPAGRAIMGGLIKGLKKKEQALKAQLASITDRIASLKSASADLMSGIADKFKTDVFGGNLRTLRAGLASSTADARTFLAALTTGVKNGLTGAFYQQLAQSGNVKLAQEVAALSPGDLAALQGTFNGRNAAADAVGQKVANDFFAKPIADQTLVLQGIRRDLQAVLKREHTITVHDKSGNPKQTAREVARRQHWAGAA